MFPLLELQPNVQAVRAVVTTRWKGNGYRPLVIDSLESYYVDTALDNDADSWEVVIGDPTGEYLPLIRRDNEVRIQLFGIGDNLNYIVTGIADDVDFQDGKWTLTGRDMSSLATDSTALPHRWAKARAWAIVKKQAHDLGFQNTHLAHTKMIKKLQYTDGSESYWDFWYRLYRQEKMWLWTTANGYLVGGRLNYSNDPIYYLGDAREGDGVGIRNQLVPVVSEQLHKSSQKRFEEVVVYGTHGQNGFNVTANDPAIRDWIKKSRKVMLDTKSRTPKAARKAAWEEIFEGKVGSIEYTITIPDPGFVIQQNQVARLYLADIDFFGNFFVVGSRIQGGPEGFIQEIRLREQHMAVSNRVPAAPKLKTNEPTSLLQGSSLGKAVEQVAGTPTGWGDYFVKAAKKYHGVMDYQLFLACLLGIAQVETGFQNERENGGPGGDHHIWHPYKPQTTEKVPGNLPPGMVPAPGAGPPQYKVKVGDTKRQWEEKFANEPNAFGIRVQMGVGPMQLTSIGLKHAADDLLQPNHHDQYTGGRWHPEYNIMIAAKELQSCVQGVRATRDSDIWLAVDAYNRGVSGALSYFSASGGRVSPYAEAVRKAVNSSPGYLANVKSAVQQTQQAQQVKQDGWTTTAKASEPPLSNFPNVNKIHAFYNSFNSALASSKERRTAIVYAALYGYYNNKAMNYLQERPMQDMKPPPNLPGNSDCSQFATWCYKSGGAPDPNGLAYDGDGNTTTLWAHGSAISYGALQPGDLVFYSNPAHVGVYVGSGLIVDFGADPGPALHKVNYRSDIKGYRTYMT